MQGVDYENFMRKFRPLCEDVSTIVEQQKHIIELLKGTEAVTPKNTLKSISASLAARALEEAIGRGETIEIPSLGIKIEGGPGGFLHRES